MKRNKWGSGAGFGHRTLKVEQLEQRAMLAGNVAVSVSGGNLIITGDNHDNAVLVQEVVDEDDNPNTHAYLITGFDFADSGLPGFESGPTIIKGAGGEVEPDLGGTSARVVTGITANIVIDLKKGNDVLAVGNSAEDLLLLADECGFGLGIGSGSGGGSSSPSIALQEVLLTEKFTAPISLVINMGDGNNAVAVNGDIGVNNNAGSLVINGGKNTDFVAVGGSSEFESNSTIHGDLAIVTQKGNDNICVHNDTIFGALAINAGDGFNVVNGENFGAAAATIVTGKNNDAIFLTNFNLDTALTINSGNASNGGGDNVFVAGFTAGGGSGPNGLPVGGGAVTVVTGNGNDSVVLEEFSANAVTINTGSGNDGSGIERSIGAQLASGPIGVFGARIWVDLDGDHDIDENEPLGPLTIVTGAGNDNAEVESVTALTLTAALGAGNDRMIVEDVFIGLNMAVDAGAGNDFVDIEECTIIAVLTVAMGAGNDELEIFDVGFATLVADGGPGRDAFFNDLGVDSNGNFDVDSSGVPHIIVRNFEFFED